MRPVSGTARLRILMTVDAVGGVWTYALDLATALAMRDVETALVVMGPSPTPAQRADATQVPGLRLIETELPLEWLATGPSEVEAAGRAVARLAVETGADLVQLNAPGPAAGIAFPVPLLVMCHSCVVTWWRAMRRAALPADFRWQADLVAKAYRAANLLVAPSHAFAAATREAYGLEATPVVIHNGRRCAGARQAAAPSLFAFTAGRLWDEGKDVATLDRAAALCAVPVLAAGSLTGPNGAEATIRHLRPLGRLTEAEVAGWLAAKPIFVSAARYEPFGLAVLEAAQAGCALVLADTPVFRELWDGAALFAPPGDAAGFADSMQGLAEDGERRAALGVAARERAHRYGIDAQADAMMGVYLGLLRGTGHRMGREFAA